jgi:hypothetical protein|tara:strand:+ start:176 stop:436 length:261 start_codon:yes stop_codon:yes gene_type:complete
MKYDDDWKWQFRIIKSHDKYESIDGKLSIQECLFDEDNVMVAHTTDYIVDGINLDEIRDKLKNMLTSIEKPILSEIRGIDYDKLER